MPVNGEIMEISGLGQPDASYTSFLYVKLTKNGKPVQGTVDFYDEDQKKLSSQQTSAAGDVLATFPLVKTTRIYVSVPGMLDTKTVPGMTTDNAAEAKQPINTVTYELPAAAGGGGGPGILAFWDGMTTPEKVMLIGGTVAVLGIIIIIAANKKESPLMEGIDSALGWIGLGEDCEE
jgi:hypothetical protein